HGSWSVRTDRPGAGALPRRGNPALSSAPFGESALSGNASEARRPLREGVCRPGTGSPGRDGAGGSRVRARLGDPADRRGRSADRTAMASVSATLAGFVRAGGGTVP